MIDLTKRPEWNENLAAFQFLDRLRFGGKKSKPPCPACKNSDRVSPEGVRKGDLTGTWKCYSCPADPPVANRSFSSRTGTVLEGHGRGRHPITQFLSVLAFVADPDQRGHGLRRLLKHTELPRSSVKLMATRFAQTLLGDDNDNKVLLQSVIAEWGLPAPDAAALAELSTVLDRKTLAYAPRKVSQNGTAHHKSIQDLGSAASKSKPKLLPGMPRVVMQNGAEDADFGEWKIYESDDLSGYVVAKSLKRLLEYVGSRIMSERRPFQNRTLILGISEQAAEKGRVA